MKLEEILTELKSQPDYVKSIAEEFGFMGQDELSGLVKSKDQLLKEKKLLSKQLQGFGEYTPEKISELREDFEELQEQLKSGQAVSQNSNFDEKKIQRQMRDLQLKLDAAENEKTEYKSKYLDSQKSIAVNDVMDKYNVAKPFLNVLRAYLASSAEVQELDCGIGLFYDTEKGEVPLDIFAKSFFESEAGKAYIAKPNNSGGGSSGSGNENSAGKTITFEAFKTLTPEAREQKMSDGFTVVD